MVGNGVSVQLRGGYRDWCAQKVGSWVTDDSTGEGVNDEKQQDKSQYAHEKLVAQQVQAFRYRKYRRKNNQQDKQHCA